MLGAPGGSASRFAAQLVRASATAPIASPPRRCLTRPLHPHCTRTPPGHPPAFAAKTPSPPTSPTPSSPLFPRLPALFLTLPPLRLIGFAISLRYIHSLRLPTPRIWPLAPSAPPFSGWGAGWQWWRILGEHLRKRNSGLI